MKNLAARVLVLFSFALLGCGDPVASQGSADLAVPDAAAPDAAACTLVKPYAAKDATCDACAQKRCCAEVNTCYGSPSCDDDYVNCYLGCGLFADPDAGGADAAACVTDCGAKYPVGQVQFDAAIHCVETQCAAVCK